MRKFNVIVVSVLSFLLGTSVTLFFVSFDNIKSNNGLQSFSSLGYGVNYENITNRYFLIIIIISSPDNLSKRNTIRSTWLQFISEDSSVKHLFVIGTQGLANDQKKKIAQESSRHSDVVALNTITDSYNSLSKKVLTSFVVIEKEYNFKFVLKCDDDSFVHVPDIIKELKTRFHDHKLLYWGFFDGRAHVKRTGKWKEANWILCDRYLPYALGGGYVISTLLVKYISKNSELFSLFINEDVSMGVWLAPLNITRVHDPRFNTEFVSRGCSNKYLITHKQSQQDMRHLYSETVTHGRMCTQEVQFRRSYLYNWNVPPTKCCIRNDSSVP